MGADESLTLGFEHDLEHRSHRTVQAGPRYEGRMIPGRGQRPGISPGNRPESLEKLAATQTIRFSVRHSMRRAVFHVLAFVIFHVLAFVAERD